MPIRARAVAPLLAALLALAACGGESGVGQPGHTPVSVAPIVSTTATTAPSITPTIVPPATLQLTNFGMHVQRLGSWPDMSIGSFRVWNVDSTWGGLEPSQGGWDFEALDNRVQQAEESGATVVLVLGMAPAWAAGRPELEGFGGSPSMPSDIETWKTYVRTVAERYAGRIEAYEVWNEANLTQFWAGTPEELATLTATASAEIRATDPDALVVSTGLSGRTAGSTDFFTAFTAALPTDTVDVVGLHVYPYPGDGPESMLAMIATFRGLADDAGLTDLPMWNTEIGYGRTPNSIFEGDTAAALILRTYLVLPSVDVQRNYWYMWDDRGFVGLFLTERDHVTPTDAADAYADAERWLVGATLQGCNADAVGVWTCLLVRDGVTSQIVWSINGDAAVPVPPGDTMAYRFHGESDAVQEGAAYTVSDVPVLFTPVPNELYE